MVDFRATGRAADTSPVGQVLFLGGALMCVDSSLPLVSLDLLCGWRFEHYWVWGARVIADKQ